MSSVMPKQPAGPPAIADEVCIAALELVLKPLGTSLRHYMPASKAAAIDAMRGVLMAEREWCASIAEDAPIFVPLWMETLQGREDQARISIASCIRGEA